MGNVIRLANREDCAEMLAIYAPYVRDTVISFEYAPPSPEEFEGRFIRFTAAYPWLVCERDGRVAGYAYAHRFHERAAFDWTAECSIYLRDDCRGKGMGRALYTCLLETLRMQGCRTAMASVCVPNPASEALHSAFGFERRSLLQNVGYKKGAWRNLAWYALALSACDGDPAPLRPPGDIAATDEFAALCEKSARMIVTD